MSSKLSLLHRTTSQGMIRLDESETFWVKMRLAAPKLDLPHLQKEQKRPHRSILTLGSVWEPNDKGSKKNPDEGFGEFLKACFQCKTKLQDDKDVYMYGYLRAFCSPACRDNQMSWDGFPKLDSSEPTKLITGRKDVRSQGLGRKNGIPIPAAMYN